VRSQDALAQQDLQSLNNTHICENGKCIAASHSSYLKMPTATPL